MRWWETKTGKYILAILVIPLVLLICWYVSKTWGGIGLLVMGIVIIILGPIIMKFDEKLRERKENKSDSN